MAKINIYVTEKYTNLDMKDATELDAVLAIAAIFDRLTPDTKKLVIRKLENIANEDKDAIINSQKD